MMHKHPGGHQPFSPLAQHPQSLVLPKATGVHNEARLEKAVSQTRLKFCTRFISFNLPS